MNRWITLGCLLAAACGGRAIKESPENEGAAASGASTGYVPTPWQFNPGGVGGTYNVAGTVGVVETPASGGQASVPEPPALADCDDMPAEPLPLIVTDSYAASGYYESSAQELTPSALPCQDRPEGAVGECLGFSWTPLSLTWVGLLFQYPANNWDGPGLCIEEGANQVSFYARGEVGGEVVDFSVVDVVLSTVLNASWTRYSIDLEGIDYNDHFLEAGGVRGAFSVVLTRSEDDLEPKTVYIDDVQWLRAEVGTGGAGDAGGAGGAPAGGETSAGADAGGFAGH